MLNVDDRVSVLTATSAGLDWPGNAAWMRSSVSTVGALRGSDDRPDCAVCSWSVGIASVASNAAARMAATAGRRSTGVRMADQTRLSPDWRRSRPSSGIRPFSTRSPSFDRTAGSTVSEPTIATATTIIVAIENDSNVLSPENNIPAIAIITVAPEINTERPEVAAAAWSAARSPRPAARSSRSRRR